LNLDKGKAWIIWWPDERVSTSPVPKLEDSRELPLLEGEELPRPFSQAPGLFALLKRRVKVGEK
jgi:hypothetical protein